MARILAIAAVAEFAKRTTDHGPRTKTPTSVADQVAHLPDHGPRLLPPRRGAGPRHPLPSRRAAGGPTDRDHTLRCAPKDTHLRGFTALRLRHPQSLSKRTKTSTSVAGRKDGRKDTHCVRREPCKVLIFSGCNSHPASGVAGSSR